MSVAFPIIEALYLIGTILKSDLEKIKGLEKDYEFIANERVEINESIAYIETLDGKTFPKTRFFKVALAKNVIKGIKKEITKEATTRIEVVPATYETVTEEIIRRSCCRLKLKTFPAEYKITKNRVLIKPASSRIETYCERYPDDCYKTVIDTIEVAPATRKWIKQKKLKCTSTIIKDCEVWRFVKVPAQYKVVTKRVVKKPFPAWEIEIPAEYITVRDTVLVKPERKEYVKDCPQSKEPQTVTKRIVKEPATTKTIEIPAEYSEKETTFIQKNANIIEFELPVKYWHFPSYSIIRVIEKPPVFELKERKVLVKPMINGKVPVYDNIQEIVLKEAATTRIVEIPVKPEVCGVYMNHKPRVGEVIDEFVTVDIKATDIIRHYKPKQ